MTTMSFFRPWVEDSHLWCTCLAARPLAGIRASACYRTRREIAVNTEFCRVGRKTRVPWRRAETCSSCRAMTPSESPSEGP